jgi:isoamylase
VEGPTDDPEINKLRFQQMRNMLATLLLSEGTPMVLAGDEFARTQNGNNNAYCQDDEVSWVDWNIQENGQALMRFVQKLTTLRCQHGILRYRRFLSGEFKGELGTREVTWINPAGTQIPEEDWGDAGMHCFGMLLDGRAAVLREGEISALLLIFNSHFEEVPFTLPCAAFGAGWTLLADTSQPELNEPRRYEIEKSYQVPARSFLLFQLETEANQ